MQLPSGLVRTYCEGPAAEVVVLHVECACLTRTKAHERHRQERPSPIVGNRLRACPFRRSVRAGAGPLESPIMELPGVWEPALQAGVARAGAVRCGAKHLRWRATLARDRTHSPSHDPPGATEAAHLRPIPPHARKHSVARSHCSVPLAAINSLSFSQPNPPDDLSTPTGWFAGAQNNAGFSVNLNVWVLCTDLDP